MASSGGTWLFVSVLVWHMVLLGIQGVAKPMGQVTQSVRWVRLGTCRIGYGLGQFWVTRVLGLASVVS